VCESKADYWAAELTQAMERAEAKWLGDIPPLAEAHYAKSWADAKG
jgi:hypothetical protein